MQIKDGIGLFEDFILPNFKRFLKTLNQLTFEFLIKSYLMNGSIKPDFLVERILFCRPKFDNFPFIETPIKDYEFKLATLQSKGGHLLHLQSIQVLKIYPPECFIWLQHFIKPCACIIPDKEDRKGAPYFLKHSFLDVLKTSYNDLKAVITKKMMICDVCGTSYKESDQNRVFLNCQKVEAFIPEISKKTHLWLLDGFLNRLKPGMRFNGVCYYDLNTDFSVQNSRYLGVFKEYFVLISANIYLNVLNKPFFQELSTLTPIKSKETGLYSDFLDLKAFCNKTVGTALPDDTLMALRVALLASVMSKNRDFLKFYSNESKNIIKPHQPQNGDFLSVTDEYNMHVFIMGENEGLVLRCILELGAKLENFGVWPYNSDDNTLHEFLMQMQNGVIFIPDAGARLRKSEQYLITKILRREEIELQNKEKLLLNVALWFYGSPNGNGRIPKEPEAWTVREVLLLESSDNLDLVIDVSRRNANLKRIKHIRFDIKSSQKLVEGFVNRKPLAQKSVVFRREPDDFLENFKGKLHEIKENYNENKEFLNYHDDDDPNPAYSILKDQPVKLMQAYFKLARKAKTYSLSNYHSFRKICSALSLIRGFYTGKNNQKIELIDVILGVMLDELSTSNKLKETEKVNSVVFGTVKGSKIGNFWLDCEDENVDEEINLEFKKDKSFLTRKEREKKAFYDIYQEIMELCARVGVGN